MTKQDILSQLAEKSNGYLLTADAVAVGISKPYFIEYVKKHHYERVAQGVYLSENAWHDELYIISLRNKEVVFSHETALHLHGLMEREPLCVMLTVRRAYNATHLRKRGYKVFTSSDEIQKLGCVTKITAFGNPVLTYDMDRTICDSIRQKDRMDIQVFRYALREYMQSREKNLHNLTRYAQMLGIENEVRKYTEVLL